MNRRPPERDPFLELSDRAMERAALTARSRERARRDVAADLASWEGTLRDLAERQVRVVVRVDGDRVHDGILLAIGIDHLALGLANGSTVLIAADTVRTVRPEPGAFAPVARGDRRRSQDRTLVEVLALVVEQHADVLLRLRGIVDPVTGSVIGLGIDVLTVRLGGSDRGTVYVPLAAIVEVVLAP